MSALLILVAESAEGAYEPVGVASTRPEALEMAVADMRRRKAELEAGNGDPMCPERYVLWMEGRRVASLNYVWGGRTWEEL